RSTMHRAMRATSRSITLQHQDRTRSGPARPLSSLLAQFRTEGYGEAAKPNRFVLFLELV
ncbi:hypothetical protein, partial [Mesorhizobium sp.]|uniref:hypothetical protein n=1 Tax=Mesorhizobium sp. TaxID=1871066 RepID=UPI0025BB0893